MNFDFVKPDTIDNYLFDNYYNSVLKFVFNKELYISFQTKFFINNSDSDFDFDNYNNNTTTNTDNQNDYFKLKNKKILIINNGGFNPFNEFRSIINEYNINMTLQNEHPLFEEKLKNDIKGENDENNIKIITFNPFLFDNNNKEKDYDIIIINHTSIFENKLMVLLNNLHEYLKEDGKIYFFHTICNQSNNKLMMKNLIRDGLKKITNLPIGRTKNIIEIYEELKLINSSFIKKESDVFMKKKYLFYGEYSLHYFILQKIN